MEPGRLEPLAFSCSEHDSSPGLFEHKGVGTQEPYLIRPQRNAGLLGLL